jgi:hypothetical protein
LTNVNWALRGMLVILVVAALFFAILLLVKDAGLEILPVLSLHVISALALLLIGAAFLFVQPMMFLDAAESLKNLILSLTFILWGIVQLMPQGALSARLDNLVVVLFVLDLAWATLLALKPTQESVQPQGSLSIASALRKSANR